METITIVKARHHTAGSYEFTIPREIPVEEGAKYYVKTDGQGRIIYEPVDKPSVIEHVNDEM